jgi:tripartite-type tricarboxylate transporter receptor subunit TctC
MRQPLYAASIVLATVFVTPCHAQSRSAPPASDRFTQPIRVIVPNAPGGPVDTVARILSQKLSERIGVPVVVDNRSGASGTIGGDIVAKSAPDGRTLLMASSSQFVSLPILVPNLPYDPRNDFALITAVVQVPYLLLVNPNGGIGSVQDLIALAKSKPGSLNYGSAGTGSTSHLAAALFSSLAGLKLVHVPYKGSAPAAADLIGGRLHFVFEAVAGAMQYVKAGRLRAIGVSTAKRVSSLPDLPTIAESGVPGYEAVVTHGVCASAKTPAAIVTRLNREIVAAINTPEARERLTAIGAEIVGNSPQEYQAAIRAEIPRWDKIVREIAATAK